MVYWDKDETLGAPFVMYYNAGGVNPETGFKGERIGIALSKNMKKWRRYEATLSSPMRRRGPSRATHR